MQTVKKLQILVLKIVKKSVQLRFHNNLLMRLCQWKIKDFINISV